MKSKYWIIIHALLSGLCFYIVMTNYNTLALLGFILNGACLLDSVRRLNEETEE